MPHVYVTGHRNPDTDTIASAIAYAEYKNLVDPENHYAPARLGEVNTQTEWALKRSGAQSPKLLPHIMLRVKDVMHGGAEMPMVSEAVPATAAILEITAKKLGMTTVTDASGKLVGIITDGDLRRFIQQGGDFAKVTAGDLASRHPKTIAPDDLAAKAVERIERFSITTLVVT